MQKPSDHPEQRCRYSRDAYAKTSALVNDAKAKPCTDCGIQYPYWVMHFDHILDRGPKLFSISKRSTRGLELVAAEIAKCDVVCANCHADRTHRRALAAGRYSRWLD